MKVTKKATISYVREMLATNKAWAIIAFADTEKLTAQVAAR